MKDTVSEETVQRLQTSYDQDVAAVGKTVFRSWHPCRETGHFFSPSSWVCCRCAAPRGEDD